MFLLSDAAESLHGFFLPTHETIFVDNDVDKKQSTVNKQPAAPVRPAACHKIQQLLAPQKRWLVGHAGYYQRRNSTGVAIMYSHNIEVSENKFERSWGGAFYGILLKDISDSRIEGNIIEGNTTGVLLDSSNRNTISRNIFRDNGWALDAYGNNYGNVVTGNSFLGNHFDVTTNSRRSENTYEGNYWDRHRGYDMDGDGYGDVVYRPMSVFALWVNRNSELAILMNSPVVDFLEAAERVFPVITPDNMLDARPLMQDPNTRDKE